MKEPALPRGVIDRSLFTPSTSFGVVTLTCSFTSGSGTAAFLNPAGLISSSIHPSRVGLLDALPRFPNRLTALAEVIAVRHIAHRSKCLRRPALRSCSTETSCVVRHFE